MIWERCDATREGQRIANREQQVKRTGSICSNDGVGAGTMLVNGMRRSSTGIN